MQQTISCVGLKETSRTWLNDSCTGYHLQCAMCSSNWPQCTGNFRPVCCDLADDVSVNVEVADLSFLGLYSCSFIYQDDAQTLMQTVRGAHVYIPWSHCWIWHDVKGLPSRARAVLYVCWLIHRKLIQQPKCGILLVPAPWARHRGTYNLAGQKWHHGY